MVSQRSGGREGYETKSLAGRYTSFITPSPSPFPVLGSWLQWRDDHNSLDTSHVDPVMQGF